MKILRQILWILVYALPAVLFFSYYPVIALGGSESMNYELSLPIIWLVIFDILALIYAVLLHFSHKRPPKTSQSLHHESQKSNQAHRSSHQPAKISRPSSSRSVKTGTGAVMGKNSASVDRFTNWGYNFPGISDRRFFLFTLFPLYATLSVFWSANPVRGTLTAGVMWLVFCAVFSIIYILPQGGEPRRLRTHVLLVLFVATFFVCKYCYAQSIMDVLGVSRANTLLCPGCTYHSFGFPHPSGFAIEPQFMGNLLLAPALTALYLVVFRSRQSAQKIVGDATDLETKVEQKLLFGKIKLPRIDWHKWQHIGIILLALDFSTALFFTFSRGAIYAFGIAIIILLIFALKRETFRWSLITIPAISFLLSLTLQGTLAAVGPTAETFTSAVTKSIHQLSLGVIDLREAVDDSIKETKESLRASQSRSSANSENASTQSTQKTTNSVDDSQSADGKPVQNSSQSVQNFAETVDNSSKISGKTVDKPSKPVENIAKIVDKAVEKHEENSAKRVAQTQETAIFEGYVAESTNIRLNLNKLALWTWLAAPGHQGTFTIGLDCAHSDHRECNISTQLTPTSLLFGVGLGGAGNAMYQAYPDKLGSPKEIVQNEPFSLLLETGLVGIVLVVFSLLLAFFPQIFSRKFLDGRDTSEQSVTPSFWQHPALPLLLSLIIAYVITLNFFSGLPNALHIYLMPPLLYLIFAQSHTNVRVTLTDKASASFNHKAFTSSSHKDST